MPLSEDLAKAQAAVGGYLDQAQSDLDTAKVALDTAQNIYNKAAQRVKAIEDVAKAFVDLQQSLT